MCNSASCRWAPLLGWKASPTRDPDAGFVQLLVVAALAMVGGLLTAGLMSATQTSRQTAALERLVRGDVLAASGFQRLIAAIDGPQDILENEALRGAVSLSLADADVQLRIEANGSKIDVLAADLTLLENYLTQAGLERQRLAALLGDVGDARARSDSEGAIEAIRAVAAGLQPAEAFDRDLTRFGGPGIDPNYASSRVLRATPDLTPIDADRIAAAPEGERGEYARLSRYFTSTGRRFSLATRIEWAADAISERRLPIEISTSGKVMMLGGPH